MANHPDDIRVFRILERGPAGDGVTSGEAASIESRLTALEAATPPSDIDDLTDVDTTTSPPGDGDLLIWNATDSEWQPYTPQPFTINTAVNVSIGKVGVAMPTGFAIDARVPQLTNAEIYAWALLADQSGDISVSLWSDSFSAHPPTVADNLLTMAISGSNRASASLVGSEIPLTSGYTLRFNVNSVTTIEQVLVELRIHCDIGPAV